MTPMPPLSMLFFGVTIYESSFVPHKPGKGWFPLGPDRVAMHPDALRDLLKQIGDKGKLTIVRRLPEDTGDHNT